LDFSYVSKLENSRIPPPAADTVVKIAHVFGVTPDELLALSGKLSSDVTDAVASMPGAQEFLRLSTKLSLTDEEWRRLGSMAQQWRDKPK
jgi:transcriptional regulator with XRE-family HTH domain